MDLIKVGSIPEEYIYIRSNPHECADSTKGQWGLVMQSLTADCTDLIAVRCTHCGEDKEFEFDISSFFPSEADEFIKKLKDGGS